MYVVWQSPTIFPGVNRRNFVGFQIDEIIRRVQGADTHRFPGNRRFLNFKIATHNRLI